MSYSPSSSMRSSSVMVTIYTTNCALQHFTNSVEIDEHSCRGRSDISENNSFWFLFKTNRFIGFIQGKYKVSIKTNSWFFKFEISGGGGKGDAAGLAGIGWHAKRIGVSPSL